VFPVRYTLHIYMLFRRNSDFKGSMLLFTETNTSITHFLLNNIHHSLFGFVLWAVEGKVKGKTLL
jgi:hypothetical protein